MTLTFDLLSENLHSTKSCSGVVYANFDFSAFLFLSYEPVQDGQTDRWSRRIMRPIGQPRNKNDFVDAKH